MVNQVNPKRKGRRGRKGKTRGAADQVIDIVFMVRYDGKTGFPPRLPTIEGELTRRPGTVDGYRLVKGHVVKAKACAVTKACQLAELHFELKTQQRRWWDVSVHPETGERHEYVRPALIAKRRSEAVMAEGTATRQSLYRALREEAKLYERRGLYWDQGDSNWWKAQHTESRKKKH